MERDVRIEIKELKSIDNNFNKNKEIFEKTRNKLIELQKKCDIYDEKYEEVKKKIMKNHNKIIK